MTTNILPKLGLSMLLGLIPALAQPPLVVTVPFDFQVENTRMPAGDYNVKHITPEALVIRSADSKQARIFLTTGKSGSQVPSTAKLVFNRYGDQYFLSQIWSPTSTNARQLFLSRVEKEVAQRMTRNEAVALQATR